MAPTGARPLSPHLQIWRWTVTMAASITHRMTGAGLYAGVFLLAGFLLALAAGEETYAKLLGWIPTWIGALVLFGYAFAILFHTLNGLRHLYWDMGRGFDLAHARTTGWLAFIGAFVGAAALAAFAIN
jgi:succinate dehydrogenase / fumarate reductase, cytochrome b subunit